MKAKMKKMLSLVMACMCTAFAVAEKRYEVSVMNLYEGAADSTYDVKCYTLANGMYAPDGTTPTVEFFNQGHYLNELEFEVGDDGKVRIGLEKKQILANDYEVVGKWNLYYLGVSGTEFVDMTSLIVNPDFDPAKGDKNTSVIEGWTTSAINGYKQNTVSYNRATIDLYQDLEGLTPGIYRVTVYTYYRAGYYDEEWRRMENGEETHLTTLYATTGMDDSVDSDDWEITHLLSNPDFEDGFWGWNIEGHSIHQTTAQQYGYSGTYFLESWTVSHSTLGDADWSQTIEIPNGVYLVKSWAHAVLQSDESVVPSGVYIYANTDTVPVTTNYTNPPAEYSVIAEVTDGYLKIGYRIASCNVNWAAWDNIRVYKFDNETMVDLLFSARDEVNAYMEALDTMSLVGIKATLAAEFEYTDTIDDTSATAMYDEVQRLQQILQSAQDGVKAYNDLGICIYNCKNLVAEKPSEEFSAAIAEAEEVYSNVYASAEDYATAYENLSEAYAAFHVGNIDLSTLYYDQEVWINEWIVGLNTTYHVACVYQCYNSDSVCVVPESFQYNGEEYTTIGLGRYDYGWDYVWGNSYMIQSVQLPSTLRFLGTYALTGCNLMQEIDIPEGVEYIGEQAFGSCESLTEIVLPESLETIGNYAFGWCNSLKSITIPESVTSIGNTAFSCCSSLTSITIPTGVTSIGDNAFESCVSLSEIVLPESLETIGHGAFNWCSSLKSITIPAGVTSIGGGIFNECTQLESIYCLGTTPPVLNDDMTYSERKPLVHVPEGCAASYRVANYWNNYLVIEGEGVTVDINVEKPGTLGEKVLEQVEYLHNVNHLIVSGVLNETDLARIRNAMPYLLSLDMTEVDMAILPNDAFREHRYLMEATLPENLTVIGDNAFIQCGNLSSINIPEGVTRIEDLAFWYCANLDSLVCPSTLNFIGREAFAACYNLTSIELNEGLDSLGHSAFADCINLTEVVLPSSLAFFSVPFKWCHSIKSVTCRALIPPYLNNEYDIFSGVDKQNCVLYVPEWTLDVYRLTPGWESFVNIEPLVGYLPENINVMGNVNLTLPESLPVDYRANVSLNYSENNWEYSSLTLNSEGECVLPVGKFHMVYDANVAYDHNSDYSTQSYYTTLINNTGMRADNVSITLYNRNEVWNFFSFPYDVKVSEIVPLYENSDFVIRKYSGMERANGNMANTWQNMTADSTLHAGEGYIWHSSRYIDEWSHYNWCGFEVPAVNNTNKNLIFANDDRTVTLNEYLSEYSHNRSWNLIGNPYPAYYDTRAMDFAAPITVWNANNSTYYAYSPIDDEYILCPGEAFFVQRPVDTDAITFRADGRQTDRAVRNRAYAQTYTRSASERQVFNLTLSDGEKKDRTRFVINSAAARDYEMSRDANKFMSDDARIPQLYTIDGGVQYAINERPMDNGVVALGVRFGMKGSYTIALDTQVKGMSIVLVDKLTGIETDLMEGAYTFTAETGTINNRFEVRMRADEENGDTTGLDSLNGQVQVKAAAGKIVVTAPYEAAIEVYDAEGQRIAAATTAATAFDVEPGVYVVKVQDTVHKVSVSR